MGECTICGQPSVAFVQLFRGRKKVGTYPICLYHGMWAYGLEQLGQDWARSEFARSLGIRKGALPRIKVSLVE